MHDVIKVIIGLQFSALLPVLAVLILKPKLNTFFKLLLASIFLSIASDIVGTYCFLNKINNILYLYFYTFCNAILVTILWQKVPFYTSKNKRIVSYLGVLVFSIMIFIALAPSQSQDAFYFVASLSLFLGFLFALYFYYLRVVQVEYTPILKDPYFFTASAYILFCLSTIIILASLRYFEGTKTLQYTWLLRQIFYAFYNLIVTYAFYIYYRSQLKTS